MTEFFREVDEEVRRDRIVRLWTKYQYVLIALAVLIVAGTGAYRLYQHYRDQAAEAAGAKYEAALQLSREGKSAEAEAAFEDLAKTAPKGFATLARLRAADELAPHDPEAAIKAYAALIADPGYDQIFKDVAQVRAATLRVDRDDPTEFEQKYAPLAADTFPYRNQIRELLGLAAMKRNSLDAAGRWLDAIVSDHQAPQGVRMRAEALLGLVQAAAAPPTAGEASPSNAPQLADQPPKTPEPGNAPAK
ncbi:hypothetical protein CU048_01435 [Beijerinckiaceae bacterium]|nr:hypothetical protein CU048_01435 [Beijerinckiaceae bacterium]